MRRLRGITGPTTNTQGQVQKSPAEIQEKKLATFLDHLSETGLIGESAAVAGISRTELWRKRNTDPLFRELYQEAYDLGTEACEDEATLRATKGTLEPVFYKGRRTATIRRKSDLLLMFILKARSPEKYKDNYTPPPDTGHDTLESPREQIARKLAGLKSRTQPVTIDQ